MISLSYASLQHTCTILYLLMFIFITNEHIIHIFMSLLYSGWWGGVVDEHHQHALLTMKKQPPRNCNYIVVRCWRRRRQRYDHNCFTCFVRILWRSCSGFLYNLSIHIPSADGGMHYTCCVDTIKMVHCCNTTTYLRPSALTI